MHVALLRPVNSRHVNLRRVKRHSESRVLRLFVIVQFLLGLCGACRVQDQTAHTQAQDPMKFPTVRAKTLAGRELTFPDATSGKVALLFVAFEQAAQRQINSWFSPLLEGLLAEGRIEYYEIPMISGAYGPVSRFIDRGMRGGVPIALHDRTATFYGDRTPFFQALEIRDSSAAILFVLNSQGDILFRVEGFADAARVRATKAAIAAATSHR
jgi:hypothetical protein